jgi:hypothetical protein
LLRAERFFRDVAGGAADSATIVGFEPLVGMVLEVFEVGNVGRLGSVGLVGFVERVGCVGRTGFWGTVGRVGVVRNVGTVGKVGADFPPTILFFLGIEASLCA